MRKMLKKILTVFTAGVMVLGAASLAACSGGFTPPAGGPSAADAVDSNGGFVVKKGDYRYFINGVESYTSDNTYGSPVKGALMRAKESDILAGTGEAEMVVPSLIVAADYTSGIYIYGDRVYYATPSNVKDTNGNVLNSYLDFKSARLDGTGIESYFNVSSNSTVYRYVQTKQDGPVYLVYVESSTIHSYNTTTKKDVALAQNVGDYVLDSLDKQNGTIYYTMSVTEGLDIPSTSNNSSVTYDYTQIYKVTADATEAPYTYEWDSEYLKEHDGEAPYVNLGSIVLDGIGNSFKGDDVTQFTHDYKEGVSPLSPSGYTYTLEAYTNGGLYFTRTDLTKTSTAQEDGWLFYLPEEKISDGWNSITGNDRSNFEIVAKDTTNAGTASLFYRADGKHYYLYVSDSDMFRAEVTESGVPEVVRIAHGVGSATLVCIDDKSDETYHYVYYTASGSNGNTINRVVYNGTEDDYKTLGYEDNKPYRPVKLLDIEHARSWYNFEIIDGVLYFADAAAVGSTSYNYIAAFDLRNENKELMDTLELEELNKRYDDVYGTDGKIGDYSDKLQTALRYYYYTGETDVFYANIEEAEEKTGKNTLYSEEEVSQFKQFTEDESNPVRSDFIKNVSKMRASDEEAIGNYWQGALQHYIEPTVEDSGLPAWAWALIGVAIGLVVVGAAIALFFLLRKKKSEPAHGEEKMYVDTTDDEDVDVYASSAEEPAPEEGEPVEEPAPEESEPVEEPAPEESEPVEEPAPEGNEPVEEPAPEESEPVEEPAPESTEEKPE